MWLNQEVGIAFGSVVSSRRCLLFILTVQPWTFRAIRLICVASLCNAHLKVNGIYIWVIYVQGIIKVFSCPPLSTVWAHMSWKLCCFFIFKIITFLELFYITTFVCVCFFCFCFFFYLDKVSSFSKTLDSSCVNWAKQATHRCLVYLGDLSRYVLDLHPHWDAGLAVRYYSQVSVCM